MEGRFCTQSNAQEEVSAGKESYCRKRGERLGNQTKRRVRS